MLTAAKSLSSISILGTGLLIGAALTIIIPEGMSAMLASDPKSIHAIGIFLLAGFALMLLVETFTPHPPHIHHESHPMLPKDPAEPSMSDPTSGLSATLGLVIHGAADGIAIGASSLTGTAELGLVVFLAVLVHKGPAALGLTTTLMGLGLSPTQIKNRLLVFSLSAPIGAIITYALISIFGAGADGANINGKYGLGWWTGAVLLFSGGSFLYVATVIQPLSRNDCHGPSDSVSPVARAWLLVLGMLIPLGLAFLVGGHEH